MPVPAKPIITLMTDFGLKDGNVGVMKGVIWGICPDAQIADLSHLIGAQNISEAALILARSAPYFPPGAVHLVVVDPGVGTRRRPIAARLGDQFFVGPDNGIITPLLEKLEENGQEPEIVVLDRREYWLPRISHVFHGRDIFSPSAAHLASGVPLRELGTSIDDPVRIDLPRPVKIENGLRGEVIHIDHFGNVASNIRSEHLEGRRGLTVRCRSAVVSGLVDTFGERQPGDLVALFGSTGNLILSVVNGSAAAKLGARVGDPFEVVWGGS